ncbi:serine/threonine kinase receptor associated protein, partial [Clavulina sp. PMI_390]
MAARVIPLTCSGHTRPVVHLSFSNMLDEESKFLLVSSCKDGNPMLRDWKGDWIGTFVGHKGAVWSTKLSRDASKAATGSADFTAKVWDTYSGAVLHSFPHNHIVRTVALSPSASHLITAGNEKKVRLFDLTRPDAAPNFMKRGTANEAHDGTIKSIIWDGDRAVGVTAGEDKVIRWWDLRNLVEIHSVTLPTAPLSLELSQAKQRLIVCAGKEVSFLPLVPNSAPTHTVTVPHAPSCASLHPTFTDRFVAGSVADPWVRVYGLDNGEEREVYKGHHGPVHCIEYSPDGEMYATGSEDGTIRLWQTVPGRSYGLWQGTDDANGG